MCFSVFSFVLWYSSEAGREQEDDRAPQGRAGRSQVGR